MLGRFRDNDHAQSLPESGMLGAEAVVMAQEPVQEELQEHDSANHDLVRDVLAGIPLALDRLLLQESSRLLARIERRIPRQLSALISAEDVLQDTLAEAFRTAGSFRPEGPDACYKWLLRIAEHRLIDLIRAHRAAKRGGGRRLAPTVSTSSVAALIDLFAVHEHTPSRTARGHEAAAAIEIALAGLREEYRQAITLRYLQGLSIAEIAGRMGKTESAVHKLCSRGLQALRKSMGEAGGYLSSS